MFCPLLSFLVDPHLVRLCGVAIGGAEGVVAGAGVPVLIMGFAGGVSLPWACFRSILQLTSMITRIMIAPAVLIKHQCIHWMPRNDVGLKIVRLGSVEVLKLMA